MGCHIYRKKNKMWHLENHPDSYQDDNQHFAFVNPRMFAGQAFAHHATSFAHHAPLCHVWEIAFFLMLDL